MEQAQAELSALGAQAASAFPLTHARLQPRVMPYAHPILDIQGITTRDFTAMQSLISMLALIVAVNVGVLVYARTATRQREIAVRTALGASRRRIVGQLFIEALVLSAAASAAGIGLARFGIAQGFAIYAAEGNDAVPYFLKLDMPLAAYVYVAMLTVIAAVVAGVLPALHATGRRAQDTLKQASGTDGLRLGRVWTAMIIAQVAIAVTGLPATMMISWSGMQRGLTRANYNEESFLAATVTADPDPPAGMPASVYERESVVRFEKTKTDLVTRLEAEPAVDDVTVAATIPGAEPRARIAIDGAVNVQAGALDVGFNRVAADFFDAFGARIIAGRALRDSDSTGATQAIVVNRAFVNQLLGGANAVGRRVHYVEAGRREPARGGTTTQYEIVGVVTDLGTNTIAAGFDRSGHLSLAAELDARDGADSDARQRSVAVLITPSRPDLGARSHAAVADRDIQRDEAAADDWAPPDGARLLAGDRDRAAAVGGRHLRNDVVHRIAAPQGNRHPGRDGR